MVYEKHQPRQLWRLGRVMPSKDGEIRWVKLRDGTSIISRPINIYLLEAADDPIENKELLNSKFDDVQKLKINGPNSKCPKFGNY